MATASCDASSASPRGPGPHASSPPREDAPALSSRCDASPQPSARPWRVAWLYAAAFVAASAAAAFDEPALCALAASAAAAAAVAAAAAAAAAAASSACASLTRAGWARRRHCVPSVAASASLSVPASGLAHPPCPPTPRRTHSPHKEAAAAPCAQAPPQPPLTRLLLVVTRPAVLCAPLDAAAATPRAADALGAQCVAPRRGPRV